MQTFKRILIIEDNPDDEALLLRQLTKAGLQEHVKVINDGRKALKYLAEPEAENLVAIFLDLKLPKVSGIEIFQTLRKHSQFEDLSVVIMTSSNDPDELESCRRLRAASFVAKPLTFSSFAKAFADTFHAKRELVEAHIVE